MSTPQNPQEFFSPFLPATYSVPEEEDRRKTFLVDNLSKISDVVNDKKIGLYRQGVSNFNGNTFWYDSTKKVRNGYSALARISSFPNAGVLTLTLTSNQVYPINNFGPQFVVSHVWGSASRPCSSVGANDGDYFSFMAQGDSRVSFTMSDTELIITTTVDLSDYQGFIIIEFIKDGV